MSRSHEVDGFFGTHRLRLDGLTEEVLSLERPAMTYVREQFRQRLAGEVSRCFRRWLHPSSGRQPGDRFL